MLKVAKFGGSSVAKADQFKKVKEIIDSDPSIAIVVASAAGKRSADDHKLTDLLYLCHAHLTYGVDCKDIISSIRDRFSEIKEELNLSIDIESEFDNYTSSLSKSTSVDELVSRGEYFTSRLLAEYLGFKFVDAAECIFFSTNGKIDADKTYAAIKDVLDKFRRVLIPGFYGSLPSGKIKVMTRGGSDITGSLAAAAVNADVYQNWTDVSGILMADPRIVDNPKPIPAITYDELREMAFAGASVLHEESVQPVREKGICLNIRNTNEPDNPGTLIVEKIDREETSSSDERFITGIAGRRDFDIITVSKHNMTNETICRALTVMQNYHVKVEHITLGLDSFALVASEKALGDNIYDIISDMSKSCDTSDISIQDKIALIAAVGRRMPFKPGISGKLFKALGDNEINIRTIAQGADELSITVGVENEMFEKAIRVLYDGFAG